jgi:hypothetical protein
MIAPFTLPLDIEVWADHEEEFEQLFVELHEADPQPEYEMQPKPEGAL